MFEYDLSFLSVGAITHSDSKSTWRRRRVYFMLYFQVIVHHREKSGKEFKQKLEQKQWSNAYSLALSYSLIQINLTA